MVRTYLVRKRNELVLANQNEIVIQELVTKHGGKTV